MIRKILVMLLLVSGVLNAMGSDVNYDDKMNQEEQNAINTNVSKILSTVQLKSLAFQEKEGKNIPVEKVARGSKVVYINRVINHDNETKADIVVKNPIPEGTKYIVGSATCSNDCVIGYSTDGGESFSTEEHEGEVYTNIEFYFKTLPPKKEFRMGFRVIVE